MKKTDIDLIFIADNLDWNEWDKIGKLIELAESEEAKNELRDREKFLYYKEEAMTGNI